MTDVTHPRDFKGKYFNYRLDPGATVQPGTVLDRGIRRNSTTSVTTHLRDSAVAPHGAVWKFKFLKYWAGAITRTRLDQPVLTGPMSGCILCRYVKNGQNFVAHIGTAHTPTDPATIAVKTAWTAYMNAGGVLNVVGRKPTQVIPDLDVIAHFAGGNVPQVWGYFTTTDAWALLIGETNGGPGGARCNQILTARPMALLPWVAIPGHW